MLFIYHFISSFIFYIENCKIPQVGSIYQKKIYIPIIGKQIIQAEISNNNIAQITLQGFINKKGSIKYFYNDDKCILKLNYNLRKIIQKYKTELTFPYYDIDNDIINFNIDVKSIKYSTKIKMNRMN